MSTVVHDHQNTYTVNLFKTQEMDLQLCITILTFFNHGIRLLP